MFGVHRAGPASARFARRNDAWRQSGEARCETGRAGDHSCEGIGESQRRPAIVNGFGIPELPNALWQHWGEPSLFWFAGSHLAPFARRSVVRAIVHHLEALEIL
jgi:hypothetical protein